MNSGNKFIIINIKFLPILVELILLMISGYSIWYKTFLPNAYFFVSIILSVLIVAQLYSKKLRTTVIIQIFFLGLFLKNVYYLYTNYAIIPFEDANWDYALARVYIEDGKISIITASDSRVLRLMGWYSQWPSLHIFAMFLSQIAGIDVFYLALLIPSAISLISFLFTFLIIENIRKELNFHYSITPISLIIYSISAESLFYSIQFVQQNIAILFVTIALYLIFKLHVYDRRYLAIIFFFLVSVVISHSFTSFVFVNCLIILSFLFFFFCNIAGLRKYTGKMLKKHTFTQFASLSIVSLFLAVLWWELYGTGFWVHLKSGIDRFVEIIKGMREFEYLPFPTTYPNALTSPEFIIMLIFRDIAIYLPAICSFLCIFIKNNGNYQKYILVSSFLALGSLFSIDYFLFRIEAFRILIIFMPIIYTLSALAYSKIFSKLKVLQVIVTICITVLIVSSFIGLWGHRFAPAHLYTPSIKQVDVGERYGDSLRVNYFFATRVPFDDYQLILTDDVNPLARLLSTKHYSKIELLAFANYTTLNRMGKILVCSFKDLFMYSYFSGKFSPLANTREAESVKSALNQHLTNLNLILNDGKYRIWVGY